MYRCDKNDGVSEVVLIAIIKNHKQKKVVFLSTRYVQATECNAFGDPSLIIVYNNPNSSIEKDTY